MLAAGGTGGHIFPAEALAHELTARGWQVHLATDDRAKLFTSQFPAVAIHPIKSSTIVSKNPIELLCVFWSIWSGVRQASGLIAKVKPSVVIGFGGYPTLPPLYAATRLNVPTMVHEQNAVMGRANKTLVAMVNAVAVGFLQENLGVNSAKTVVTGNPVRPAVIEAAKVPYVASGGTDRFNLLVFGGSQGAKFFSDAIPAAITLLPKEQRKRLRVTQQARKEDVDKVKAAYVKLGIEADISPFFTNMAERMSAAQLVISRSGAATVSEISIISRPALLVPYPYGLNDDQTANAAQLAAAGGGEVHPQATISVERIAELLGRAMSDPERLADMAAAAKSVCKADATRLLADLAEAIASKIPISEFKKGART